MYYAIGGVGVSGFSSYKAIYGYNNSSGSSGASAKFNLNSPALVLIIALVSSQNLISISGIPGFTIDATNNNTFYSSEAIMIGHTYLNSGSYNASEQSANIVNTVPQHRADLIGIFAFFGSQSTFVSGNKAVFILVAIVIVIIVIASTIILILLRKRGEKQKMLSLGSKIEKEAGKLNEKSIQRLTKLKELYEKGFITEKEYEEQKKKL